MNPSPSPMPLATPAIPPPPRSQALAVGWCTLAASGLGGPLAVAAEARRALRALLASADLRPTPALLNTLSQTGWVGMRGGGEGGGRGGRL